MRGGSKLGKSKEQIKDELLMEIQYWEDKLKELAQEPIGRSLPEITENQRAQEAILMWIKEKRELLNTFFRKDAPTPIEDGSEKFPLH